MTYTAFEQLAEAHRVIADFKQRVAQQQDLIAGLARDSQSTEKAEELLRMLEETLRTGEQHRQLLLDALAKDEFLLTAPTRRL